ncbi:hypothetical protein L1I30_10915 [Gillisia sp. M10.2A]|uniref:Uncharacterized protein n=1 Tax=Gillisia lutea TaxID=2909668 RepID=A0ABS9EK40_9FLAO|nr:hypothetical protein [Gillisia lutea]MCF4102180.1 hypothetical protein [Gillisia lutea]
MKIVFICGSLEPGRDGVGDYTRRLGIELVGQGHVVVLIAINDFHIKKDIVSNIDNGDGISILRLAPGKSYKERFARVKHRIDKFDPDWLSLQYVPFSFQKKGIPWNLDAQLEELGVGRKWHIMFHELWVGMDVESPVKHRILGIAQEYIAGKIIKRLAPKVIHTQSNLYRLYLERFGCKIEVLPLFSNIPVLHKSKNFKNDSVLTLVVFGMIQPGAPIMQFVNDLSIYRLKSNKKIKIQFIGRLGNELGTWVEAFQKENFNVHVLGEQGAENISEILSKADWGISSTPLYQIEKSGTVVAMREHQLPVYCVARSWKPRKIAQSIVQDLVKEYTPGELDFSLTADFKEQSNNLKKVSKVFSESLQYQKQYL